MGKHLSTMILNGENIGISKIELNKSDLLIIDKSGKYCLKVCVLYSWKDINKIKTLKKQEIDFNECCLSENNEAALVWPSNSYVEKISSDLLCFYLEFSDLANTTHYMNQRGRFDILLYSLEVKVFIRFKDIVNGSIIYDLSYFEEE